MSRMIKTSVLAALLGNAGATNPMHMANPVNVHMDMLTDFTAKFTMDTSVLIHNELAPPGVAMSMPSLSLHGEVQANVGGERLKITLHAAASMPNHPVNYGLPNPLIGAHGKGSAELIFDGPGGFVVYRGTEEDKIPSMVGGDGGDSTPSIKADFCLKVNFPKGLLPPGQMLTSQFDQVQQMIDHQLNTMPHTHRNVDGVSVAIYNSKEVSHEDGPPVYFGVKEMDGTPVGVGLEHPAHGTWAPFFRFTQWTHGARFSTLRVSSAGEVSEIQCTESLDSTSLAAARHAAVDMQVFDRVMASLKGVDALHPVFAAFPAKPSLIFKSAGNAATALEEQPASSSSLFPTIAVAVAAGAFGGLVSFFALSKGTSKANRVSLISDDA